MLEGNPQQSLWLEYVGPTGTFSSGIWASEVGTWKVVYSEEEYCQILEGHSVLTSVDGTRQEFTEGMEFIIPRGFVGTWRVIRPTRKRFVIYEPPVSADG